MILLNHFCKKISVTDHLFLSSKSCSPKSTAVVAHWLNNVIGIDTSRQAHIRAGFVTYFFRHELKLKSRSNFVKLQILINVLAHVQWLEDHPY